MESPAADGAQQSEGGAGGMGSNPKVPKAKPSDDARKFRLKAVGHNMLKGSPRSSGAEPADSLFWSPRNCGLDLAALCFCPAGLRSARRERDSPVDSYSLRMQFASSVKGSPVSPCRLLNGQLLSPRSALNERRTRKGEPPDLLLWQPVVYGWDFPMSAATSTLQG